MSSIKCPSCNLTNFSTAQFCKRCNLALNQPSTNRTQNETQIFNSAGNTHIRQTPPMRQNEPVYQNNQQNYQSHQPFQPAYQQPQSYDYSLPQFPNGQRPPQYNSFQNPPYYQPSEPAFRRFGSDIALHRNATLPENCIKCGNSLAYNAGGFVAQKYRWHHPALYIALISPIIYLILSLCVSERFKINLPLCGEHIEKRETAKTFLILGGIVSTVLVVLSFSLGWVGFGFLLFFAALIVLTSVNEYGFKPVRVSKLEGSYFYLKGASNEFLNTLPY